LKTTSATIKKLPGVNCRALHAAFCGVFCIFNKIYQVVNKKKRFCRVPKKTFSQGRNLVAQNFVDFESKKCNCKKSCFVQIVELFTLHLMFFLNRRYQVIKR
jgi:hypothetical protein